MKSSASNEKVVEEGRRYDVAKVRTDLMQWVGVLEVLKVGTFGASKYEDNNWRKGMKWMRFIAACLRHIFRWVVLREARDRQSDCHHLAHAAWNLLALVEFELLGQHQQFDDRPYCKQSEQVYYQALLEAFERNYPTEESASQSQSEMQHTLPL